MLLRTFSGITHKKIVQKEEMLLSSKIILQIHCSDQSVKLMPNFHRLLIYTSIYLFSFGKCNELFIEIHFFKKASLKTSY